MVSRKAVGRPRKGHFRKCIPEWGQHCAGSHSPCSVLTPTLTQSSGMESLEGTTEQWGCAGVGTRVSLHILATG